MKQKLLFKLWLLILSSFLSSEVYSQDPQDQEFKKLSDTLFKSIINEEFGTLMASQSRSDIGNYAGLDLKEASVSFSGNIVFKNAAILGIKLEGGAADGLLPIFTSTKLNSKVGFELQYSFLVREKGIIYESLSFEDVKKKQKDLLRQYVLDTLLAGRQEVLLRQQIAEGVEKRGAMDSLANLYSSNTYKNLQNRLLIQAVAERVRITSELVKNRPQKEKDSLTLMLYKQEAAIAGIKKEIKSESELSKMRYDREKLDTEISFLRTDLKELENVTIRKGELEERYDIEKKKLENNQGDKKIIVSGYKLQWLSIGYSFNNMEFKLFDPVASFEDQIHKDHFISHRISLMYSFYKLSDSPWKSRFLSGSIEGAIEDNFNDLTKTTINERNNFNNPDDTRYGTEQYVAYTGEYKDYLGTIRFTIDYYQFFLKNNFGAFHIFPQYVIKEDLNPRMNLGLGLVFSFKDKSNTSSTVNAELYYNSTDLANVAESDKAFFKRGDLGIRVSFPIKFNTK